MADPQLGGLPHLGGLLHLGALSFLMTIVYLGIEKKQPSGHEEKLNAIVTKDYIHEVEKSSEAECAEQIASEMKKCKWYCEWNLLKHFVLDERLEFPWMYLTWMAALVKSYDVFIVCILALFSGSIFIYGVMAETFGHIYHYPAWLENLSFIVQSAVPPSIILLSLLYRDRHQKIKSWCDRVFLNVRNFIDQKTAEWRKKQLATSLSQPIV